MFDLSEQPYRKATFLLTDEEFELLEDLKLALRRAHGMKTSKEDIVRCGIHLLHSLYHLEGEQSSLVKSLRKKHLR